MLAVTSKNTKQLLGACRGRPGQFLQQDSSPNCLQGEPPACSLIHTARIQGTTRAYSDCLMLQRSPWSAVQIFQPNKPSKGEAGADWPSRSPGSLPEPEFPTELVEQNVSICFVWKAQEHVDLASISSPENLPLALAGHHPVPAKSTARAADVHKGPAGQGRFCLPGLLSSASCQQIGCAQRRTKHFAQGFYYAMTRKITM